MIFDKFWMSGFSDQAPALGFFAPDAHNRYQMQNHALMESASFVRRDIFRAAVLL